MNAFRGRSPLVRLAVALCLAVAGRAGAEEPGRAEASREARRLLDDVQAAYKALAAYEDHGTLEVEYVSIPAKPKQTAQTVTAPCRLAFERPRKFAVAFGSVRLCSNGRDEITVVDSLKRYGVKAAPAALGLDIFTTDLSGEVLFSGLDSLPLSVLLTLAWGGDGPEAIARITHPVVSLEPDRSIDGTFCKCLVLGQLDERPHGLHGAGKAMVYRLLVDPGTKLLRAVEFELKPPRVLFSLIPLPAPPDPPPGFEGAVVLPPVAVMAPLLPHRWIWRAGAIATTAPEPRVFTFTPPPGYTKVKSDEELFELPETGLPLPPPNPPGPPAKLLDEPGAVPGQVQKAADDEPIDPITPNTIRVEPLDPDREGGWIMLRGFRELGSPTFSKDGAWVAFDAYREGYNNSPSECWVARRDGRDLRKLAVGATPRWSPDGKKLLFMRDEGNNRTRRGGVFVIDRDGTHETRVCDGRWPDWSPDAKKITFSIGGEPGGGLRLGATICTADTDGSNRREIAEGDCPSWSPDGKQIAYCVRSVNALPEICVADLEENVQAPIGIGWFRANWSPDGKALFANGMIERRRVGMVKFTLQTRWTSAAFLPDFEDPSSPCPSADGKSVVFIAKRK